ncbi:ETX/MTX2 family pore-forming toxin [Streptomyces lavendulae]|uniref:ETX/MTX2 family pore-forming toxin n=1 Tax=Streptomyces lavendulae TaxID=1914 RepID=UPI0038092E0A
MAGERYPRSRGCRFTASTDYNRHSMLNGYHQHQVLAKYKSTLYDPSAPSPEPGSVTSIVSSYENGSSLEQSDKFTQTITTKRSLKLSVTQALKIGVALQVSAEIPAVAKVNETTTIETNLAATQEFITEETQTWTVERVVRVPARSVIDASLVIGTQKYDIDWTATVELTGRVAIWFNEKVDLDDGGVGHWLWFVPIETVFRDCREHGLIGLDGYEADPRGVRAFAGGTFSGGQGVKWSIKLVQRNLDGTPRREPEAVRVIPLAADGTSLFSAGRDSG